jgi:transposase-like protein
MARQCSICHNQAKGEIDRALIGGVQQSEIAREHGVSQAALSRHLHRHLAPTLARAIGKYEPADAERLGSYALGLLEESLFGMVKAKKAQDDAEVRAWMAEARKNLELRARLGGIIGAERVKIDMADAQRQMQVLAGMSEDELRQLARSDQPALEPAGEQPRWDVVAMAVETPHEQRDPGPLAGTEPASIDAESVEEW